MGKKICMTALLLVCATTAFTGCSRNNGSSGSTDSDTGAEHEAITMMTSGNDYGAFEEALHQVYPEVNIEFVSYKGYDTTDYCFTQLKAEDITDIFAISQVPSEEMQKNNLIDLSGEDFINNMHLSLLSDVTFDGGIYMLPSNVSFFGNYYNKTLFEKHGWKVPTSMEELEELIPKIKAAGVNVSECATQYYGSSFSFLFNVAAPDFTTSLEGIKWMNEYTAGKTPATGHIESAVATFKHLIDIGMINVGSTPESDASTIARFKEGNTAFLVTVTNDMTFTQNSDGTGDEYGIMPYLSYGGDNNVIVTKVSYYYGLSKKLQDNPQKLEDALKVMAFMATPEGQKSLVTKSNMISPLKNDIVASDHPLYDVSVMVDQGKSMSLVYWELYTADIGMETLELMKGNIDETTFIKRLDEIQKNVVAGDGGVKKLADVQEDLTKQELAQLVGTCFAKATGADCALISIGDFHGHGYENNKGVNAKLYSSVTLDKNVVCTFNPLGWTNTIKLMTLTGADIKQYAAEGFFKTGDETPFEYVLVTKDGAVLDDNTTYTVACVIEYGDRATKGNLSDSGVVGQDALVKYIEQLGTISKETIKWK